MVYHITKLEKPQINRKVNSMQGLGRVKHQMPTNPQNFSWFVLKHPPLQVNVLDPYPIELCRNLQNCKDMFKKTRQEDPAIQVEYPGLTTWGSQFKLCGYIPSLPPLRLFNPCWLDLLIKQVLVNSMISHPNGGVWNWVCPYLSDSILKPHTFSYWV
jgi:hypothetical protein